MTRKSANWPPTSIWCWASHRKFELFGSLSASLSARSPPEGPGFLPDTRQHPSDHGLQAAARLRERGDLAGAAACYEQTLAADPEHLDVHYLYGTTLLQLGRLREAIVVFRRVAQLRPEVADVQNN